MPVPFDYLRAFSRNIGWITPAEQDRLRNCRVAIAGMGGVGGSHLLTLARLGIGKFRIADFDSFDLVNFNRQAGAGMSSLGKPKTQVMADLARDINPELEIEVLDQGLREDNLVAFLTGCDAYVDGLDFFAFDMRLRTFTACAALGVPAVTAAPLGMGSAMMNFVPGGMGFDDYFCWSGQADDERALRFMIGLAPRLLQDYIVVPESVNLDERRGPSTVMACQLCAGIAATEVLKLVLGRGQVLAAPHGMHFDAYRNKLVRTWRPGGNRNPIQRVMLAVARRRLATMRAQAATKP
jgi:molybdopterin/thiamine biosynthesis adenylyltransferase